MTTQSALEGALWYYKNNISNTKVIYMAFDPNQPFGAQQAEPQSAPTMSEDQIRSMRGDLAKAATPPGVTPAPTPTEPTLNIPAKPLFDADEPAFSPNTSNQMPPSVDDLIAQGGSKKKMMWVVGGIIGVLVLGAVGYFVIYPMISSVGSGPTVPTDPTVPVVPVDPQPIQPIAPQGHVSAFVNQPENQTATAVLPLPLSRNAIAGALTQIAQTAKPGLTEVTFTTGTNNAPAALPGFITALTPGFANAGNAALLFEDDFTAFTYKDAQGVWPGYVLSLKPDFKADDLRAWFAGLEKSPLSNFFIVNPGTMAPFKDGTVNGKYADRYSGGTTPGASLGYLMLPQQSKVIISSSFTGIKESLRLMGL